MGASKGEQSCIAQVILVVAYDAGMVAGSREC